MEKNGNKEWEMFLDRTNNRFFFYYIEKDQQRIYNNRHIWFKNSVAQTVYDIQPISIDETLQENTKKFNSTMSQQSEPLPLGFASAQT